LKPKEDDGGGLMLFHPTRAEIDARRHDVYDLVVVKGLSESRALAELRARGHASVSPATLYKDRAQIHQALALHHRTHPETIGAAVVVARARLEHIFGEALRAWARTLEPIEQQRVTERRDAAGGLIGKDAEIVRGPPRPNHHLLNEALLAVVRIAEIEGVIQASGSAARAVAGDGPPTTRVEALILQVVNQQVDKLSTEEISAIVDEGVSRLTADTEVPASTGNGGAPPRRRGGPRSGKRPANGNESPAGAR